MSQRRIDDHEAFDILDDTLDDRDEEQESVDADNGRPSNPLSNVRGKAEAAGSDDESVDAPSVSDSDKSDG